MARIKIHGKELQALANAILKKPEMFMIDSDGKLFAMCVDCTEWHLISTLKLNLKKMDDDPD